MDKTTRVDDSKYVPYVSYTKKNKEESKKNRKISKKSRKINRRK